MYTINNFRFQNILSLFEKYTIKNVELIIAI